jgi:hypothetical protein
VKFLPERLTFEEPVVKTGSFAVADARSAGVYEARRRRAGCFAGAAFWSTLVGAAAFGGPFRSSPVDVAKASA